MLYNVLLIILLGFAAEKKGSNKSQRTVLYIITTSCVALVSAVFWALCSEGLMVGNAGSIAIALLGFGLIFYSIGLIALKKPPSHWNED